jgi:hypothetical protein
MGIANPCYNVGPALESRFGSRDVAGYRRVAFTAGLWFSMALPFVIPVLVFTAGCRSAPP